MSDLVLSIVVLARSGSVTSTNDGDDPILCACNHGIHKTLGADLERLHLKHANWAIPNHRLCLLHCGCIRLNRLWPTIQAHHATRDATLQSSRGDLAILTELGGSDEVTRQDDFYPFCLCLLHDFWHNLRTLLVKERVANLHVVGHLEEGVCHATTNDHHVHLVQQVLDELDLVANLGSSQYAQNWLGRCLKHLGEGIQLLGHKESRALHWKAVAHHGAVIAVSSSESITAEHIAQLGEALTELLDGLLVSFHFVPLRVYAFALFLQVETHILKQNDGAWSGIRTSLLHLLTCAVCKESHWLAHLLLDYLGNWCQ
mmetsp:Transcript_31735/g.72414  ORF Transcript_31735/g.72414 Transcript_31735/m.72414 type:complete len:315 (-) Transcript_31735:315-1259(-)